MCRMVDTRGADLAQEAICSNVRVGNSLNYVEVFKRGIRDLWTGAHTSR